MLTLTLQRFSITREAIDLNALIRAVTTQGEQTSNGGISSFLGVVRDNSHGRKVIALEYEAYEPMAVCILRRIDEEVTALWPAVRLAIQHRIGRLEPGEASVAIVAASPHRAEAFAAARYAIERVKQIAPVWKREVFETGDAWVEGAAIDPDDPVAREEARRRACRSV